MELLDTWHNGYGRLEIYEKDNFKICKLFKDPDKLIDVYQVKKDLGNKKLADMFLSKLIPQSQLEFEF